MTIIDRFEGSIAVLETDSGITNIERSLLPENAAEGDVLIYDDGSWSIDKAATEKRRSRIKSRLKRLINKTDKRGKND
ncbi:MULTISPECIES: DUF3006 domain-containing protein [Ruminococcus]|uniref:DUF3006 family protein n=1 Tax=Ruminococcus flavefaciens TaxID=1265 RepID=A0A1M7ILL1_RUMFL|nr:MULTISPECIES: DUF3006 domain-containing protein [Ruminococcus]MCR4796005.1 DUF3006 domain-containing protein [Ruminococcus sp.]SHM41610.1 Protein of unknown function [Ruminococcus flavefaciens]